MTLSAAIENLYTAFADVTKPSRLEGSPYSSDPVHLQRLVNIPLQEIDSADMGKYGAKATTTIGTGADYLYYLPRLLELSSQELMTWPSPEILLGRLRGNECPMKEHHWDAIHEFLAAWWLNLLDQPYEQTEELKGLFSGVLLMGADHGPYLKLWDEHTSATATHQLAWFIQQNMSALSSGDTFNAFLGNSYGPQLAALKGWLLRREMVERLEKEFFADPDGSVAEDISNALLYLGATS